MIFWNFSSIKIWKQKIFQYLTIKSINVSWFDIQFLWTYLKHMFHFVAFQRFLINLAVILTFHVSFDIVRNPRNISTFSPFEPAIDIFRLFNARSYVNWLNGENKFNALWICYKNSSDSSCQWNQMREMNWNLLNFMPQYLMEVRI